MARTKSSVGAKVSSGKSSKARCSAAPTTAVISSSTGVEKSRGGGGNSVCPRETPKWQRPITNFFIQPQIVDESAAGSSKSKRKRHIIESSDEDSSPKKSSPEKVVNLPENSNLEVFTDNKSPPKNSELDETIELEELTGENSHKIEEYYPKDSKGKGIGKKSKGKENNNNEIRSGKREREDNILEENSNKKIKIH